MCMRSLPAKAGNAAYTRPFAASKKKKKSGLKILHRQKENSSFNRQIKNENFWKLLRFSFHSK